MVSPDHAELCQQEISENAEANGACQAWLDMIRYLGGQTPCRATCRMTASRAQKRS